MNQNNVKAHMYDSTHLKIGVATRSLSSDHIALLGQMLKFKRLLLYGL